jgi:uncharacterized protein CbrC (UPF0167 family)
MTKPGQHAERAHSKFSASGSERWLKCAASVALEEMSPPSPDTPWSKEGTYAHEVLEGLLRFGKPIQHCHDQQMLAHCRKAAGYINHAATMEINDSGALLIEKRVYNSDIHDEMFGTCDAIIVVHGKSIHIIDFKYGAGHIVDPVENTQLIQYALGVADAYDWNFRTVKMTILQPRAGKEWAKSWTITAKELKTKWLPLWKKGVERVERGDAKPFPGSHCHWCRAKRICPAKKEKSFNDVLNRFNDTTEGNENGKKENKEKSHHQEKSKSKKILESFQTEAEENGEPDFY